MEPCSVHLNRYVWHFMVHEGKPSVAAQLLWEGHRNVIIEDPELEGASRAKIRELHTQLIKKYEVFGTDDIRYRFCLSIDRCCLQSILASLYPPDLWDWRLAWVKEGRTGVLIHLDIYEVLSFTFSSEDWVEYVADFDEHLAPPGYVYYAYERWIRMEEKINGQMAHLSAGRKTHGVTNIDTIAWVGY
ncbi:hypothetical protein EYZ11_009042 [Aspergillus tanneri]|uniref:Uncharacterized protein n=1 Tax=Aspergillus tanneri TaxID=1220188 RepID=A0A4S3J9C0_9EURO|nr:hypothetical protein EYZ11_009042 [Aspergillus tanneri]